jgi:ankyrin repeat protein
VNVEIKDNSGDTPIFHAAGTGRVEVVKLLLKAGAKPNVIGRYGNCPLTVAIAERHFKVAELLRAAGGKECK